MAHILVAEDERDIRELINFTLMFAGHTVTLASNGEEAVELATKALAEGKKPDLIMTDVRMPKMTGYEACRQLKLLDAFKDTPVVFLSAKGQDEEIQSGMSVGAAAYILKPFSPTELTKRVGELLDGVSHSRGMPGTTSTPGTPTTPGTPGTPGAPGTTTGTTGTA
jgi:CheY-like chemotaxis protein